MKLKDLLEYNMGIQGKDANAKSNVDEPELDVPGDDPTAKDNDIQIIPARPQRRKMPCRSTCNILRCFTFLYLTSLTLLCVGLVYFICLFCNLLDFGSLRFTSLYVTVRRSTLFQLKSFFFTLLKFM